MIPSSDTTPYCIVFFQTGCQIHNPGCLNSLYPPCWKHTTSANNQFSDFSFVQVLNHCRGNGAKSLQIIQLIFPETNQMCKHVSKYYCRRGEEMYFACRHFAMAFHSTFMLWNIFSWCSLHPQTSSQPTALNNEQFNSPPQQQLRGCNFDGISFDDAIALIQLWYNFFANSHR